MGLSTLAPEELDDSPPSALRTSISTIFTDAQRLTTGHHKLVISLRKIQEICCYENTTRNKSALDAFAENDFRNEILRCVLRIAFAKKGESVGDRLVRFLGSFLKYANEKDAALAPLQTADNVVAVLENPSTRLTSQLIAILSPLLTAKDKSVRYRSTQLISHIVNSLDCLDDEVYRLIRTELLGRIKDKESMIRTQAVLGLCRLAGDEGGEDADDDSQDSDDSCNLLERLLWVLQNDPSAEVRRALLLNLPLTPTTLPFLLERARDLDPATRRALFSRLLPALGDFRHLSLSMREKLLRWGLRDRDETVRKATAKLFRERWIGDCVGALTPMIPNQPNDMVPRSSEALLELLERIDVVNSGVENGIALDAMMEFWRGRPDFRDAISFDDAFWESLSAESVFLARSFNDFCREESNGKHESLADQKIPEVTQMALHIRRYSDDLIQHLRQLGEIEGIEGEEDTVEQEFIVEQLLHIAQTLDYSDEVGRRKIFALLREILAVAELPEEITKLVVQTLRIVCGNHTEAEREFCGVILEAIAEVHDTIVPEEIAADEEDESFHSARSVLNDAKSKTIAGSKNLSLEELERDENQTIKEITVNLKCLFIAQSMLQNVELTLDGNVHLVTMLNNLVVPAVRSHEAPIRERGLLCLGLCCLLDKHLAVENLTVFIHCFSKGHEALQVTALHVLSDILISHHTLLSNLIDPTLRKSVLKVFSKGIKTNQDPRIQLAATTALCKLMLFDIIKDDDLLKRLVLSYFDPATKDNLAVRQALNYFLLVYSHSRRENMERMGAVAPSVLHALCGLSESLEEDEDMVEQDLVANMLLEWTDARKLVVSDAANVSWDEAGKKETQSVNGDIHLLMGEIFLDRVLSHGCAKEERRTLLSLLGKLYVTSFSTADKLQSVYDLVEKAIELKVATDAPSRTGLTKFHTAIKKAIMESSVRTERMIGVADGATLLEEQE